MNKTVLLVEDEMFVALDLQMIFEDGGWQVAGPFPSTQEALEYLAVNKPDCAVLDVRLADGDVYPVADALAAIDVPFVFHSGHADNAQLNVRYPQSKLCSKPCKPSDLLEEAHRMAA
ncbi:response regulator [Rhizobium sp.]|jgi:CheY-like chemotaxis protein|uniref:response regulator n=1 Tax=Rhizobium sp. TaxID=391 RepID=UPI00289A79DF